MARHQFLSGNAGLTIPGVGGAACSSYEVRSLVNRIVDERTGEMITFGSDSVILEGA